MISMFSEGLSSSRQAARYIMAWSHSFCDIYRTRGGHRIEQSQRDPTPRGSKFGNYLATRDG